MAINDILKLILMISLLKKLENRYLKFTLKNGEVINITNQEEYDNLVNRISKENNLNSDATTILTSGNFGTLQIHPELSKFNKISYYNS